MTDTEQKKTKEQEQAERIAKLEKEVEFLVENVNRINKYVYPKATLERYLKNKRGNVVTRFFLHILYYFSRFSMFFIEKFGFIMGNFVRKLLFFVFLLWLSFFGVTKYVQYQLNSYTESINQKVKSNLQKVRDDILDPSKKGLKKMNESFNKNVIEPLKKHLK